MPAYWWECTTCKMKVDFKQACGRRGMPDFIWDVLLPSDWDQTHLVIGCPGCGQQSLRIAYEFPRAERVGLVVIHAVGLGPLDNVWIPMMWETHPDDGSEENWFDFKYISGRSAWGLNILNIHPRVLECYLQGLHR